MNLQRIFILIAAAVLTAAFGQYYFRKKKLLFKALATCMPVAVALLYTLRAGEQGRFVSLLILAGAFLCMTADVLLELVFLAGVAAFALGHVCFLTAYIHLTPVRLMTVILFVLLLTVMLLLHGKFLPNFGSQAIYLVGYGALLSFLTAMAFTVAVQSEGPAGKLMAAGGICFYISDNILGFRILHEKNNRLSGAVLLALYYSAVYLIAAGLWFLP